MSAERAASNCFTGALCGDDYRDTAAVQALFTTEGKADDAEVGDVCFALGTLAMGDLNATTYAQCGHVQILRESGAMPAESMLTYRGVPPAGKIHEGIIIDDHVVAAAVPRRGWKQSAAGLSSRLRRRFRRPLSLFPVARPTPETRICPFSSLLR